MVKPIYNQTTITRTRKYKQVNVIGVEYKGEEMSTETHEEINTLPNKTVLTFMGAHLYGYSINYGMDVPQFQYDAVHTVGAEFEEDMLMNIVKVWDKGNNEKFHNIFQN